MTDASQCPRLQHSAAHCGLVSLQEAKGHAAGKWSAKRARLNTTAHRAVIDSNDNAMKTFFREEMVVVDRKLTIPSHQKATRLLATLQKRGTLKTVGDFPAVKLRQWNGIHDVDYVRRVADANSDTFEAASIPVSRRMAEAIAFGAGSLLAATTAAMQSGCAFSPTAGFHHAHWAQPGAFCLLNALPLAARHALSNRSINRVLILDCDYHRGNGTNDILARLGDDRIVHKSFGYHFRHRKQSPDYLQAIERVSQSILSGEFDFVIYQAGMDVLIGDPAGGGLLSLDATRVRDSIVFSACRRSGVPIVWNLAGGYQVPDSSGFDPVVEGHLNTYNCALEQFA